MGIIKSTRKALLEERRKSEALRAQVARSAADLQYVAMMADIELDEEDGEDEQQV